MARLLHFDRVALAALTSQYCQLVEGAASAVIALLRSTRARQGMAVETYVLYWSVAGMRVGTCLHETVRMLVIGLAQLFTVAGEQVSHLSDPS